MKLLVLLYQAPNNLQYFLLLFYQIASRMLDFGNFLFLVLQSLKDILVLSIDLLQLAAVQMEYLLRIFKSVKKRQNNNVTRIKNCPGQKI